MTEPQGDPRAGHFSRRRFLSAAAAGAAGFAAAVPVLAARTVTPSEALRIEEVRVASGGARIPLYVARPRAAGNHPLVVIAHEIFGAHEHIKDIGRRFAHAGFVALVPELYSREGGVGHLTSFDDILKVVLSVSDDQVLQDLDAVVAYARSQPYGREGRLGVTGFCWGGRVAWLYAAHNPNLAAGVAWYGRLAEWSPSPARPHHPIALAGRIHCPMLGLYGGADRGIPVSGVRRMEDALAAAGKTAELVVYPHAPHAFFADYRESYREEAARDAWGRCLAWFDRHLWI